MVQASQNGFTADGVVSMTEVCGTNRMQVYATFLSSCNAVFSSTGRPLKSPQQIATAAQKDPIVLEALQQQREVFHMGVSLNLEDEKWALEHGITLTASR